MHFINGDTLDLGMINDIDSHPGQLSFLLFVGLGNEYRPKCGDALRLGSKGRMAYFIRG